MPVQDSIIKAVDTIGKFKTDSVALLDSLAKADSIAKTDSNRIIAAVKHTSGMEGTAFHSFPSNEPWVFVVLIVLFLLFTVGILKSGSEKLRSLQSGFKHNDLWGTSNVSTVNYIQSQILLITFSIGVFSLFVYELFYRSPGLFDLKTYLLLTGATTGFYLIKYISFQLIGTVFFDSKTVIKFQKIYFNILSLLAIVLFPVLFLYTYQPQSWRYSLEIIATLFLVSYYILLVIKVFQIFYTKVLAVFYIFLYLCTLEIIPLVALFRVYELII